jgi:hypothetical protein
MTSAESLFFALLRSGLWGSSPALPEAEPSLEDWKKIYGLSMAQTVVGLVTDGAAACPAGFVPKAVSLKLMSSLVSTEKLNSVLNSNVSRFVSLLEEHGVQPVLVKGQAVAQCYIHPGGRMPGDIDLVISPSQYEAAKAVIAPIADEVGIESAFNLHFGAMFGELELELHGTVRTSLGRRINDVLDAAQAGLHKEGGCRFWDCLGTQVRIPSIDFDALFIFTHLLQHFYCGGLGLRQLCDWARVLHTHCGSIDLALLESRLAKMGLLDEWKAFVLFLVRYLGLPQEEAPLYDERFSAKADKLWRYIERVGNFGRSKRLRDRSKDPYLIRKIESLAVNSQDFFHHLSIFPLDSLRFFWQYFKIGTRAVVRGE